MNVDIQSLFPDLEALTPEGRWNMLQDWLAKNPEYGERAERWSKQPVDQVFDEIVNLTTKKHGPLAGVVLGMVGVELKIKSAIEVMQTCYRERANNQTEKEIKNVGTNRQIRGKQSAKSPRRVVSKTNRTDQAGD